MANRRKKYKPGKKNRGGERLRRWRLFHGCRTYNKTRPKPEQSTSCSEETQESRLGSTTECVDVDLKLDVRQSEDDTLIERIFMVDLKYEENKQFRRASKQPKEEKSRCLNPKNDGLCVNTEIKDPSETKQWTTRSHAQSIAEPEKEKSSHNWPSETKLSTIKSQDMSSTGVSEKEAVERYWPSEIEDLASTRVRDNTHRDNSPSTTNTQIQKPPTENVGNESNENCPASILQYGPRMCTTHNLILKNEHHESLRSAFRFQCSLCDKVEDVCVERVSRDTVDEGTGTKEVFARVGRNCFQEPDETIGFSRECSRAVEVAPKKTVERESTTKSLGGYRKTISAFPAGADERPPTTAENIPQPLIEPWKCIPGSSNTDQSRKKKCDLHKNIENKRFLKDEALRNERIAAVRQAEDLDRTSSACVSQKDAFFIFPTISGKVCKIIQPLKRSPKEGNTSLIGMCPTKLRQNKSICEKHFESKYILPSGRLLNGTVPKCYVLPPDDGDVAPSTSESQTDVELSTSDSQTQHVAPSNTESQPQVAPSTSDSQPHVAPSISENQPHVATTTSETRICSDHFKDDDFELSLQQQLLGYVPKYGRNLKSDAVPSVNLPTQNVVVDTNLNTKTYVYRRRKQLLDCVSDSQDDIVVERLDYSQGKWSNGDEDDTNKVKRRKLQTKKIALSGHGQPTTSRVGYDSETDDSTANERGGDDLGDQPQPDQQIFIEENQAYKTLKNDQKQKREEELYEEYQRVKKSLLTASEGLETMYHNMKKVRREEEDDCSVYVRSVADRLRQLSSTARATVQSRIDNLLFEAFLQDTTVTAQDTETIEISETNIKIECQDESYT